MYTFSCFKINLREMTYIFTMYPWDEQMCMSFFVCKFWKWRVCSHCISYGKTTASPVPKTLRKYLLSWPFQRYIYCSVYWQNIGNSKKPLRIPNGSVLFRIPNTPGVPCKYVPFKFNPIKIQTVNSCEAFECMIVYFSYTKSSSSNILTANYPNVD